MLIAAVISAQNDIENVEVEIYYVTDGSDATDTISSGVPAGAITYRVYIDLCDDCALRAIYGDENHPLIINSTAVFHNNADRGKTFGHEINHSALDENLVALDSWLSLGAGSNQRAGIPKEEDPNGSIIGGANNDGGSANVPGGLLVNQDPTAGIPITEADGLMPYDGIPALPPNFYVTGEDPSTVFKDSSAASVFQSNNVRIGSSTPGMRGATAANKVLVAQLTTTGELTFKLNVEIEKPGGVIVKYVSSDEVLLPGEIPSGHLSYPPVCGCMDPDYLEYDPSAGCDDGSCATAIVFGCLDTLACNFGANGANFHVEELCCFGPGDCNGLDISIVCPDVGIWENAAAAGILIAPNPAFDRTMLHLPEVLGPVRYFLTDALGRAVLSSTTTVPAGVPIEIDLHDLRADIYYLHVHGEHGGRTLPLVKL